MTDRIRTTISVPQDVYEVFKQMADASGTSVSRCMGDWLADTAEGAQHVSMQLQRAREVSKIGIKELHAALKGDFMQVAMAEGVVPQQTDSDRRPPRAAAVPPAPSSNTGLKSTGRGKPSGSKS